MIFGQGRGLGGRLRRTQVRRFPKETPCRRYDDDAAEHGGWLRGLQDHVMHRCGGAVVRWCGGAVVRWCI
ncbi:hypothetical protein Ae717Ps2_5962c [Pseudonocardia sp. Ae717_Ps2]|nr:hypothetical protein Ae717Ps2_5962c [Pseudonocardia sp. Ae717_Ps2]